MARPKMEDLGIVIDVPKRGRRGMSEDRSDLAGSGGKAGRNRGGDSNRVSRAKSDTTGGGLAKLARIAEGHPEVMVKVSSCSRGREQLGEHLNYITRNGKLIGETPHGEVSGRREVSDVAQAWWDSNGEAIGQRRQAAAEVLKLSTVVRSDVERAALLSEVRAEITSMSHGYHLAERWQLKEVASPDPRKQVLSLRLPLGTELEGFKEALARGVANTLGALHAHRIDEFQVGSKESVNLVLSMPPETDRDKFVAGAKRFAERAFGDNHDYLLVEHRDTDHPHVHVSVRSLGYDGTRLSHKKDDLRLWREDLAQQLRGQGLLAEASPRRTRGVVQKAMTQPVFHLDACKSSTAQRDKVRDAVLSITGQIQQGQHPWEAESLKRQRQIRGSWARLADQLEREGGEERGIAVAIRTFLADMPPVETERQRLRRAVQDELANRTAGASRPGIDRDEPDA